MSAPNRFPLQRSKAAVIALRKALGKTQQAFAVDILRCAIATVARYETSHPPRGETLVRLATIAEENNLSDLRNQFLMLYLDEVLSNVQFDGVFVGTGREPNGYLVVKLKGRAQIAVAERFSSLHLTGKGRKAATSAGGIEGNT